jgi:hypothetical protein
MRCCGSNPSGPLGRRRPLLPRSRRARRPFCCGASQLRLMPRVWSAGGQNPFSKPSWYETAVERGISGAWHGSQRPRADRRTGGNAPPPVAIDVAATAVSRGGPWRRPSFVKGYGDPVQIRATPWRTDGCSSRAQPNGRRITKPALRHPTPKTTGSTNGTPGGSPDRPFAHNGLPVRRGAWVLVEDQKRKTA